jgi:flagellar basal body rod protein FlgF
MTQATTTAGEPGTDGDRAPAERMRAIAAELTARLHHSKAGWDITATLHRNSGRETDVIIDEDGYTEIRYWNPPGATPGQVTAVIIAALAIIHDQAGQGR